MNKLEYSISLREKGLVSNDIKKKMKEKGFDESEIEHYIKKSDEIFLNRLMNNNKNNKTKTKAKLSNNIRKLALAISFIFLIGAFFGYVTTGLLGLFCVWYLIRFGSYRE